MNIVNLTEQVFMKLLNMNMTAAYCMAAVLLLRMVLKRQPKIYSYVLWSAVFFRLACPVSLHSALSFFKTAAQDVPQDAGVQIVPQFMPQFRFQNRFAGQAGHAVNQMSGQAARTADLQDSSGLLQLLPALAAFLWAAGLAVLVCYCAAAYVRMGRWLQGAVLLEEGVYEARSIHTPFVYGLLRPRIYLPKGMEEREKKFVLAHEKTHVRRRDYLIKPAAFFLCCIHWFNPLVWLSFELMCRDMEMSCDERVIRTFGAESGKEYSAVLLSMASGRKIVLAGPLFCEKGGIRQRIMNVMRYKKRGLCLSVCLTAFVAVFLAGLLLNPKEELQAGQADLEREEETGLEGKVWQEEGTGRKQDDEADDISSVIRYKGYLDESPYQEWRNVCVQEDFDFDGSRDRIYRDVKEQAVSYRIEFGSGDILDFGESESFFMIPEISSARIPYEDSVMILFAGQRTESTDPFSDGDIALYAKLGSSYQKINLPGAGDNGFLDAGEKRAGYQITESYDARSNVIQAEIKEAGTTLVLKPEEDLEDGYLAESRTAFDAGFVLYHEETCIVLYQNAGGKWRQDIAAFVLKVHPSARSDRQPFELELVFAGWAEELEQLQN